MVFSQYGDIPLNSLLCYNKINYLHIYTYYSVCTSLAASQIPMQINLITWKALNNQTPQYIKDMLVLCTPKRNTMQISCYECTTCSSDS